MSKDKSGREPLISRRQGAEILSVSPKTIREYEKQGLLTPIRLNCRVTRYRREELEGLIAKASCAAPKQQP